MPKLAYQQDLLVIRPWLSTCVSGDAYAHFDALVMRRYGEAEPQRYGDLGVIHQGDDERNVLFLDGFRFECQIDQRRPEAYAWRWGYNSARGGMFTADDVDRYGKSIAAIKRGLDRIYQEDGVAESVDGIVVLETSRTGGFAAGFTLRHRATAPNFGPITHRIDDLQRELHEQCAARLRPAAA